MTFTTHTPPPTWWSATRKPLSPEDWQEAVARAGEQLATLPLAQVRDRAKVSDLARKALLSALSDRGFASVPEDELAPYLSQVISQVGGLRFLDPLIQPHCDDYTDIQLNADGSVWARPKGQLAHVLLPDVKPGIEEAWQVIERLLAPEGKACTEATPAVDAKIPRDPALGFGGARIKVIHPSLVVGEYPVLSIRLYEPKPVPPEQIVAWNVFPQPVMDALLEAVASRLRVLIAGGTGSGKTTLLSALAHGIPRETRIVTVEDPNEIWLPHPNVIALEARHAPPGSDTPPYTVADGVDDALRMAPEVILVGEVRTGQAAMSLFRAIMSDHAGMTTFHADGPEHAVHRLCVIMYADAGVSYQAARGMFAEALDLVVQVGWREGVRRGLGVWEMAGLSGKNVSFRQLWKPGEETMQPPTRARI